MHRSYRIIVHGKSSNSFVMAGSAAEASEIAAKLTHDGEEITIEDPEHNILSAEQLSDIIRTGGGR